MISENQGNMYYSMKEYDKAEECFAKCLETYRSVLGELHPDTIKTTKNLGGFN